MSDIAPLGRPDPTGPLSYDASARPRRAEAAASTHITRGADRVDVSPAAREATLVAKLKDLPVREDVVAAARAAIANGTYETEDRLDAAVDAILEDFA